jgi:hypothetical protein
MPLDTLQACFARIHFVSKGSLHLRNVSRDEKIPQNIVRLIKLFKGASTLF